MNWVYGVTAALALLPALNSFINLRRLRLPPLPLDDAARVTILIPARNEASTIDACLDAALASVGADIDVIVLDDGSTDDTWPILQRRAALDTRLRIVQSRRLPPGMKGKPHACQVLSGMTDSPFLLFVDADVRLAPTAAARLIPPATLDLVSGVPRQLTQGIVETAVIPMINSLIRGYVPVGIMRKKPLESLAVACGQLIMVRALAYRRCGGHGAIAGYMHDGMQLARSFRRHGFGTDLVDATELACCRMYDSPTAVMQGFGKNATEGMARPRVLPLWTVLLGGGHLASLALSAFVLWRGDWSAASAALVAATTLLILARVAQAMRCRESWRAVVLHPLGVVLTLVIQWRALYHALKGNTVTWRGRTYAPTR